MRERTSDEYKQTLLWLSSKVENDRDHYSSVQTPLVQVLSTERKNLFVFTNLLLTTICGINYVHCGNSKRIMNPVLESIVGSKSATLVLLFIQNYGSGHASRIAKTFGVSVMGIQRQLKRLEQSGALTSQMVGSSRLFSFNERNPTVKGLRHFLEGELEVLPSETKAKYFRQRQRPRRSGKPL